MPIYNKLVRDKIPDIIRSSGKDCDCIKLEEESYVSELKRKLREEVEEYIRAGDDTEGLKNWPIFLKWSVLLLKFIKSFQKM